MSAALRGIASVEDVVALGARYPLFPCGPDKRPRVKSGFHAATQDAAQLRAWWRQWPDSLVGVPTGQQTGLVVIDYDPDKATSATHGWMAEHTDLLLSTRTHKTGRGGFHYLFASRDRYQTGTDLVLGGSPRRGIDLRANGGYVIWWPAHTGERPETPIATLPSGLIDERRFDRDRDLAPLPQASPADWQRDRPRAADALAFLSPNGYDSWIRTGMAIHAASGGSDDGFALWHEWSAQGESYDGIEDCRYHWASFGRHGGRGITLGSVFAAARSAGYVMVSAAPELPPASAYEDERIADAEPSIEAEAGPERRPLRWRELEEQSVPERQWAIPHWLGIGHVTLIAGPGGVGKSLLAQQLGAALAVGDTFLEAAERPLRVLFWAGEDDADELWRRQVCIASEARRDLRDYAERFVVESYEGRDCSLAELAFGTLAPTRMLRELEEQAADYDADVILLDNVARLYGGSENDRHQVTQFINWVSGACNRHKRTAVGLLGHPAKAAGSEWAGSTAWEAAVRSRWYFGRTLPDVADDDAKETDPDVRYLARRKSNYSALDTVRMRYDHIRHLLKIDSDAGPVARGLHPLRAETLVVEALTQLVSMGVSTSDEKRNAQFLPRVMVDRKLADPSQIPSLTDALFRLQKAGKVVRKQVGTYANRTPRMGLAPVETHNGPHNG